MSASASNNVDPVQQEEKPIDEQAVTENPAGQTQPWKAVVPTTDGEPVTANENDPIITADGSEPSENIGDNVRIRSIPVVTGGGSGAKIGG